MKKNSTNFFMHQYIRSFLLIIFLVVNHHVYSQYIEQYQISPSNGDKMIEIKNYQEGVRQFERLAKERS